MNHEWRKHPRLINLLHPDYPDDLQVVVHDGTSTDKQAS